MPQPSMPLAPSKTDSSLAVIFDIDGVLVDSNPTHFKSWRIAAQEAGFDFTEELFFKTYGQRSESIILNNWNRPVTLDEAVAIAVRKEKIYCDLFDQEVPVMPGVLDFIECLARRQIPMAAGSSGPRINVDYVLDKIKIRPFLQSVVAGTDVPQGKPAPDIFLQNAKELNFSPAQCVVLDDSRSGIIAARRAGMIAVGFFSLGHQPDEYDEAQCVVSSFVELAFLWDNAANTFAFPANAIQ